MEYLSRLLNQLKNQVAFKYHPRCAKLGITYLSFADDLLLFARGDFESVVALHQCFTQVTQASVLQTNLDKSSVYCGGVAMEERTRILAFLKYTVGELPFKYLGIPLSTKKISVSQWQPLIDKIITKISSWTSKKLSYAGRIQLVQTAIFGMQTYWA
ncbi:uncharacterized protein LOC132034914 [Lycium ferocissimum]|uniref:uncharacterized protein LOC132034914 n=1 Tax=Lycium ferocissimum TaxID=112874 RepID=UPI0028159DDD|nr:uncharacterized protein LOC132034914 [Lycium ferocissimum]